jgi:hypothetical protein
MARPDSNCYNADSPPFPGGIFYVFLHGLIAVSVNRTAKHIDLLIPDIGSNHVYRYGEFLGEVTLPSSTAPYQITGLDPNDPPQNERIFPASDHLVTKDFTPICAETRLYARIRLPLPRNVFSYLKVDLSGVLHDPRKHLESVNGTFTGTMIPVLEYTFQDPRAILFGREPLNVAPLEHNGTWYMNLHIFAEEDVARLEDHTLAGFGVIASLFDFKAAPVVTSVSSIPPVRKGDLPCGTTALEFLSLALRTRELGYLGRLVRREALEGEPIIVRVSSVGGDPVTCLPLVSE